MVLRLISIWLLLFLLLSCDDEIVIETTDVNLNGKELYQLNCFDCHGEDGKLGLGKAADLSISRLSLLEMISIISNGSQNGKMAPFSTKRHGDLTDNQIKAVAEFVETLRSN